MTYNSKQGMTVLSKIIYTIIFLIFFITITTKILQFFEIGFDKYGNLLLWTIGLSIFFSILPSRPYFFDLPTK